MNIEATTADPVLLGMVGARLAALRVAANLTQEQLAEQSGLGLRTVQRMEQGAAATQLSGFLRVCRVLGVLDRLDQFLPEAQPGPIAQLRSQGRRRRRVRRRKTETDASANWTWGTET